MKDKDSDNMAKKALIVFLILILYLFLMIFFLSPSQVFGETILILEGPAAPLVPGPGTFKIAVYGNGIADFTAVQTVLQFRDAEDILSDDFQISETNGNPDFAGQAIWPNEIEFPLIFPVYVDVPGNSFYRQMAGFMLLAGSADLSAKTLLQTIWYDYTVSSAGFFSITPDFSETLISDSGGSAIIYSVTPGSVTIIPEPSAYVLLIFGIISLSVYFRREILYPLILG